MTDTELDDQVRLIKESFLRGAPCSPPRTQDEIDSAYRRLTELAAERPDRAAAIQAALRALVRECSAEGLLVPGRGQELVRT